MFCLFVEVVFVCFFVLGGRNERCNMFRSTLAHFLYLFCFVCLVLGFFFLHLSRAKEKGENGGTNN